MIGMLLVMIAYSKKTNPLPIRVRLVVAEKCEFKRNNYYPNENFIPYIRPTNFVFVNN